MSNDNADNPAFLIASKYMVAEDFDRNGIPARPRVTIKYVDPKDGRDWPVLHFEESWAKPLRINATHRKALCLMFDPDHYKRWYGKKIDLCVVRGNFPNGKKTAVRIWGSPDINRSYSFEVQRFGSRDKDHYTLEPTGKNLVLGPGVVRFGRKAGHLGKPFAEYDSVEKLAELITFAEDWLKTEDAKKAAPKQLDDLRVNIAELREEIKKRTQPHEDPAQPIEQAPEPELPI